MTDSLQDRITASYEQAASSYEADPAHGVGHEEMAAWRAILDPGRTSLKGRRVLDVGAGTGIVSRILDDMGATVTALDPSPSMLGHIPDHAVSIVEGDTHDRVLFAPESFDLITARQVVSCLIDPPAAFANWRLWLKPGGRVLVVDGFWKRSGWRDPSLAQALPLAEVDTIDMPRRLLAEAGFHIEFAGIAGNLSLDRKSRYVIRGMRDYDMATERALC